MNVHVCTCTCIIYYDCTFIIHPFFFLQEIKSLQEANDRLSSQLLQHGKQLMAEQPKSLLEELEDAPRTEVDMTRANICVHIRKLNSIDKTLSRTYCVVE